MNYAQEIIADLEARIATAQSYLDRGEGFPGAGIGCTFNDAERLDITRRYISSLNDAITISYRVMQRRAGY
jgi:hypothetical protein